MILIAFLISIGALGTDLMLPALGLIGEELSVPNPNDTHFVVTAFFLGMAFGQLVVGPLSDALGRKPAIYLGYGIFLIGCLMSMLAESWSIMLVGRILQGLGAAAPRIVTVAMVRDEYEGRAMAQIMSIVMAVFILVPILAPAIGQGMIYLGGWRATFASLAALGIVGTAWFALRQPETLPLERRRPFRVVPIWMGLSEIVRTRMALGYTIATGLMYGMFLGYLSSAQQIFSITFGVGDLFALYFAMSAASIGLASLLNAKLVLGLGMRRLTGIALACLTLVSFGFWTFLPVFGGVPPLWLFIAWQLAAFFCVGIIFGNLNALSLEPLGQMAGLGAAFVGAIATFMCLPLAWIVASRFDGTVYPLVAGFALLGLATCGMMVWTERQPGSRHRRQK